MSIGTQTAAAVQAARMGGFAPSIHNTQPWRWRVHDATLELRAERRRQLAVTDPAGRMLTVSCGAALHHVRMALAAEGWDADIERVPGASDPDLLARLMLAGRVEVRPEAIRMVQAMRVRRTDRRPVSDVPVPAEALAAIRQAVEAEGARLHLLRREDTIDLASAAAHAQDVESLDPSWREELAYWAGGTRTEGLGVPDEAIPDRPPATIVAGRDFGPHGQLPIGEGHDRAAVYGILYGDEDSPVEWLRGGEALSAAWLVAVEHELSVLPLSAAVEVPGPRRTLRHMLANLGEPYLVLRLGIPDPAHTGPSHAPRLPADQVVEILSRSDVS